MNEKINHSLLEKPVPRRHTLGILIDIEPLRKVFGHKVHYLRISPYQITLYYLTIIKTIQIYFSYQAVNMVMGKKTSDIFLFPKQQQCGYSIPSLTAFTIMFIKHLRLEYFGICLHCPKVISIHIVCIVLCHFD